MDAILFLNCKMMLLIRKTLPEFCEKIWFSILFCAIFFSACNSGNKIRVYELRCEHIVNPLGIDTETPRFSWKISDLSGDRGQHQTAYHLLVASSPEKLERNEGDIWDSKVVVSDASHLIPFGGDILVSGMDCYWKVKIYDCKNKASEWSETARFSMGLLNRSDWKGEWIRHPSATSEKHVWFRKKFNIAGKVQSAFVHIATNGYCELYVNGKKADRRVLAPAVSRIDKRILYVTYDIAPLLGKGDNVIALWHASGWVRNNFFEPSVSQAVLLQLDGKTDKGETFGIVSDKTWKCSESNSRNTGLFQFMDMGGEEVDGRHYRTDWNTVAFDDSQWADAVQTSPLKDEGEPVLSPQMTDPSTIIATVSARQIADTVPNTYSVDMGKSFTGFLEAKFDGLQAGDTVLIRISNLTNLVEEHRQRHYYIARGENGEQFANRFNFFSGRYIHFTGLRQAPRLKDIKGYAVSSAAPRTGYFECSDEMFNRMYEVDRWTYEMCHTEGVTVDCPNRERLGYGPEGAYQTTWGLGLPCFASGAYYIKNVRDWSDVQRPDGYINNVAPQISIMAGSSLNGNAGMNIAWEHYLAYGDKKILEEAYTAGKKWLGFLDNHVVDGLLTYYDGGGRFLDFLGEWVSPGPVFEYADTPQALYFNNCVYAMTLSFFINIAEALGHADETTPYREKREIHRAKMHGKYYDASINSYFNGDQVRTAFALYSGIVPDSLQKSVLEHLEKDLTGEHPYFNIGSFTRYPYCNVLYTYPQFQEIIAGILSKTTYPGYGYFLSKGETSWPETWEIIHDQSSIVHTSYAGVTSGWFIKCLAGINPNIEGPGYSTFTIRPHTVKKLDYARAAVESPYGLIESGWTKSGNNVVYDISIPFGSKARIYLPAPASQITENGQSLASVQGVEIIEEKDGCVQILAKSGKYRLETITN
jgi:alpha-L-rhamnosidase